MKMKKFLLVGLLGVVTLCGLSSCDDDDDGGYVPFSYAVGDMVDRTSSEIAVWTLVEANDKRFARVKVLRTINDALEAAYARD